MPNINAMTKLDIARVKGFDLPKAQRVVEFCKESGGIKRLEELRAIEGMTDTLIENLKQEGVTAE